MTTKNTYDHAAEAAARSAAHAAAKAELTRARQERDDAELETDGSPADVKAWRAAQDRFAFATEMVVRAEKAVRTAERGLLNTDTELADVMASALEDAFYGLPIAVQPHKRLNIPSKLTAPMVVMAQTQPGGKLLRVGTLSGVVHVAYVAPYRWAAVPTPEELQLAGRTLTAAPIYTVRRNGTVSEAPAGWPSTWFEIHVSAVTDPAFFRSDDEDREEQAADAAPVFGAM